MKKIYKFRQKMLKNLTKWERRFLLVMLVIAAYIIVIGVIAYAVSIKNYLSYKKLVVKPPAIINSTLNHESTASASMANWKTYVDSRFKFSFEYPPDAILKPNVPNPDHDPSRGPRPLETLTIQQEAGYGWMAVKVYDPPSPPPY